MHVSFLPSLLSREKAKTEGKVAAKPVELRKNPTWHAWHVHACPMVWTRTSEVGDGGTYSGSVVFPVWALAVEECSVSLPAKGAFDALSMLPGLRFRRRPIEWKYLVCPCL